MGLARFGATIVVRRERQTGMWYGAERSLQSLFKKDAQWVFTVLAEWPDANKTEAFIQSNSLDLVDTRLQTQKVHALQP